MTESEIEAAEKAEINIIKKIWTKQGGIATIPRAEYEASWKRYNVNTLPKDVEFKYCLDYMGLIKMWYVDGTGRRIEVDCDSIANLYGYICGCIYVDRNTHDYALALGLNQVQDALDNAFKHRRLLGKNKIPYCNRFGNVI